MTTESEIVAVAANEIWRKKHTLSIPEQRLLLWAISQVKPGDSGFEPVTLTVQKYAQMCGIISGDVHRQMQEVVRAVLERTIYLKTVKEGWKGFHWLEFAEYIPHEGVISMTLSPRIAPYVLHLKERFASVRVLPAMRLRSNYSIAFFEYCCSWAGSNKMGWEMSLDELRDWLQIKNGELQKINHLQTRVLDQAKKELDRSCPWTFSYTAKKAGRKIVGYKFSILANSPDSKNEIINKSEPKDFSDRYQNSKNAWLEASSIQRKSWLAEMGNNAALAPVNNDEPSYMFLSSLKKLLEPELPL